ncbi:MAG TPA: amino acid adenylation domain-containing protein [Thiomonas arsenitoxydans]|uniref:non-ribosomal peptide synthetase n=1 Tax=Thiomonas TaxID=32012 RepID=UPI00257C43EB|nr:MULTISPECIES: non-ribosomal peptide synthetase [Thiomonas]HML82982.1 amino acid adenylation domain-containing protein [Thiomonas arsenitoxydans]
MSTTLLSHLPDADATPRACDERWPLSQTQQDILLRQELLGSAIYNIGLTVSIDGALDVLVLQRAIQEVAAAEPMLRARVVERTEGPRWQIAWAQSWRLPYTDFFSETHNPDRAAQLAAQAIEAIKTEPTPPQGPLLWKSALYRTAAQRYAWLLCFNHLLLDGYGVMRVGQRIAQRYNELLDNPLSAPPQPGPDYARFLEREQAYLQSARFERDHTFWQNRIASAQTLAAVSAPDLQTPPEPLVHQWRVSPSTWAHYLQQAAEQGLTPAQGVHFFLATYIARVTGQADVLIGMPLHNRKDALDKQTVGLFANTLPLRLNTAEGDRLPSLMRALAEDTRQILRHQQYPLDRALARQPPRQGIAGMHFDLMVSFEDFDPHATLGNARLSFAPFSGQPGFAPIAAYVRQYGDSENRPIDLVIDPRAPAALRHTEFLSARLDQHLAELIAHPQARLRDLDLLCAQERAALAALNHTAQARPAPQCMHLLVAEQARATPQAAAVRFGDTQLSYAELEQAANRLAHTLRGLGVQRDVLVPVIMERRVELVVALLAVLKAGGAYVPLDADLPPERLQRILLDTQARVVLAQRSLHAAVRAAAASETPQLLDADLTPPYGDVDAPVTDSTPDDLALVIFTSGSTGQPKGVMIPHRALCNHKLWNARVLQFGPHDRLLQKSSLSFDASISEFFMPLICGAAVHLAPPGLQRDLPALLQFVREQGITHLTLAPSTARALVDDPQLPACTSLRYVQFGGEPLDAALAARFQSLLPQATLLNYYGPSETTEDSTLYVVDGPITQTRGNLPVGRPIDNTRAYVLDEQLRQMPFDVTGEICIAGPGVARGYLGQPELTAQRFLPDPFCPGERLYRTGDLGYWSADGQLHLVGRNDEQIKIRGFRIEIGEIERRLAAHPAVAQAAVVSWKPRENDPQLAAYIVWREGHDLASVAALRQTLQISLPHYMVPSAWQVLPSLPLTPSGKIDKRALPVPQLEAATTLPRLSPRTPTEQTLWAIWHEVLGTEAFGVLDHFFELGGHSLTLTQVRSRIQQHFGIELPLADLFTHLTLAELAAQIDQRQHLASPADVIPAVDRSGLLPTSLSQRRMWVIQHFHPESVAYNITAPVRLKGAFNLSLFERALDLLIARHEGLRTQFVLRGEEPVQIILPALRVQPDYRDLRSLHAAERENAARQIASALLAQPFDLSAAPLFRISILQMQDDERVLLWVFHHAIADNWALAVLSRETLQIYAALLRGCTDPADMGLAPLRTQYADYAAWQRSATVSAARESHLQAWLQKLEGLTDLPLPTDYPRPAQPSFMGHTIYAPLSEPLQRALQGYGARHGVTPFMVLLASFNVLLARLSRRTDIAVGTPIANRHHAATEQLVGTLVNTLVMRNTVEPQATFDQLMQQVRATALHAYAHQDAPFDELVDRLGAQRADHPQDLVRVLFNVLNAPAGQLADVPFTYEAFDFDRVAAQFDLSIHVDTEFTHRIQLEYATDLFSLDTAQRLLDSYVFLTEQLLAQPALPVSSHALVTSTQRAVLGEWNTTPQPLTAPLTLPAALQLDAPDRRSRLALTDALGHTLRYGELHARALGIAHHLRQMGVGRGDRVGLCLHRQADMLAALLGVLQSGAAYVPLDPGFPPERLHYMATDAQLRCLLTQTALLPLLANADVPQLALDSAPLAGLRRDAPLPPDPARDARPEDPAYLIYTSGSTGQPKGVEVPHRAVVNFLRSMAREPGLQSDNVLLAVTTLSFDIAVLELLLPLTAGARVVLADHAQSRDPFALRDLLQTSLATVLQATPSTWRMLLDVGWPGNPDPSRPPRLRAFIGGEALPADLAPRLLAACAEVWNLYGPTETTVWSTCWRVQPGQPIVIGRPIANTQVWILDPQGQLCPIGTPGEIHIGGAGVTLGYFQRPELTAERFIPDPFSADTQASLYKTGDLGRWRHDGQLEHLGRLDHQVKIRGFRIELGEIEAALREQAGVATCVLTTYAPTPEDVRLVAYLVAKPGAATNPADLRQALRARLPDYMVPQHLVPLDALPLLPNGKHDRAALPAPQAAAPTAHTRQASRLPSTPQEQQIAAIWRELLGVERVQLTDNFFDLGGHSLLAMRAVIAIEQQLGWRIAPRRLIFESLGQLARPGAAEPHTV